MNGKIFECQKTGNQIVDDLLVLANAREHAFHAAVLDKLLALINFAIQNKMFTNRVFSDKVVRKWGEDSTEVDCYGVKLDFLFTTTKSRLSVVDVINNQKDAGRHDFEFEYPKEKVIEALDRFEGPYGKVGSPCEKVAFEGCECLDRLLAKRDGTAEVDDIDEEEASKVAKKELKRNKEDKGGRKTGEAGQRGTTKDETGKAKGEEKNDNATEAEAKVNTEGGGEGGSGGEAEGGGAEEDEDEDSLDDESVEDEDEDDESEPETEIEAVALEKKKKEEKEEAKRQEEERKKAEEEGSLIQESVAGMFGAEGEDLPHKPCIQEAIVIQFVIFTDEEAERKKEEDQRKVKAGKVCRDKCQKWFQTPDAKTMIKEEIRGRKQTARKVRPFHFALTSLSFIFCFSLLFPLSLHSSTQIPCQSSGLRQAEGTLNCADQSHRRGEEEGTCLYGTQKGL